MRIACVNYEPVTSYFKQGWSRERLAEYYNPANIAEEACIFAYRDTDWDLSPNVKVVGYSSLRELKIKCKAFKPDVIRCYEAFHPNSYYALMLALYLGVPSYLSLHDMRVRYHPRHARFTAITAYTETLAERAAEEFGRNVEVQLNGIDSAVFKPKEPSSIDPRIVNATYRVFTIGRNDPVKNVHTVLEATSILSKRLSSVAHVVAGPGMETIGFDGVHLGLGPTTDETIVDYLNWCNCFLQVQMVPDLGMAACEALMVGRPVITTGDSSGNAKYHINERNGILIPLERAKDAGFIADALQTCLDGNYDSAEIRRTAVQTYDAKTLRQREAERYTRLVHEHTTNKTIKRYLQRLWKKELHSFMQAGLIAGKMKAYLLTLAAGYTRCMLWFSTRRSLNRWIEITAIALIIVVGLSLTRENQQIECQELLHSANDSS